jgi:hypothetical protein
MDIDTGRGSSPIRRSRFLAGLVAVVTGGGLVATATPAYAHHGPPPATIVGAFGQAQVPLGLTNGRNITLGVCRGRVAHGYRTGLLPTRTTSIFSPSGGCRASAIQILFQPAGDVAHWSAEGTSEFNDVASARARGRHRIVRTVVTVTDSNGLQGRFFADAPAS